MFSTVSLAKGVFGRTKLFQKTSCLSLSTTNTTPLKRMDIKVPISEQVAPAISLITANAKEITKHNKHISVTKYQKHEGDTGSAAVQVATMTDRIRAFVVHQATHTKDHTSFRGFSMLVSRRKTMMEYLFRTNYPAFAKVVNECGLTNEANKIIKRASSKPLRKRKEQLRK